MLTDYQQKIMTNNSYLATSNKYNVITTQNVIDKFRSLGFELSSMQQANYRNSEKHAKVRHMVRMKISTDTSNLQREVVIFNSYDSSTSLRLNFGAFRAICMNTLCFGDALLPEERIKHTSKNPFERISEYADNIKASLHKEEQLRKKMENQYLSFSDQIRLAHKAITLREPELHLILDPAELNIIHRPEDSAKNLWTTYNRIQEALTQGMYKKRGYYTDPDTQETTEIYKKAKVLTDQAKLISVNKQLHTLCSQMVL
jgi:hypothetical protein